MTRHEIGTVDDFPEGEATRVEIDGISVAVFNVDGELYGIQNACPHKNLPLHLIGEKRFQSGELVDEIDEAAVRGGGENDALGAINDDELTIRCPWHGLEWDLEAGTNELLGAHIATYDLEVVGGRVFIRI